MYKINSKSIDEITLDDIKSFYDNIFIKSQGQVVVSAPFSKILN